MKNIFPLSYVSYGPYLVTFFFPFDNKSTIITQYHLIKTNLQEKVLHINQATNGIKTAKKMPPTWNEGLMEGNVFPKYQWHNIPVYSVD